MKKTPCFILLITLSSFAFAGGLDHFSTDATKGILSGNHECYTPHASAFDDVFSLFFAEILAQTLAYGGIESFNRIHGVTDFENKMRDISILDKFRPVTGITVKN